MAIHTINYYKEKLMPIYEYRCQKCQDKFTVTLSMAEHDQGKVECPRCHGKKVVQQYSVFFAKTSKKS